jgi:hypothetical protein
MLFVIWCLSSWFSLLSLTTLSRGLPTPPRCSQGLK